MLDHNAFVIQSLYLLVKLLMRVCRLLFNERLLKVTIRYDTIEEFNVDSKAEYTA